MNKLVISAVVFFVIFLLIIKYWLNLGWIESIVRAIITTVIWVIITRIFMKR